MTQPPSARPGSVRSAGPRARSSRLRLLVAALLTLAASGPAGAAVAPVPVVHDVPWGDLSHVVVPQLEGLPLQGGRGLLVDSVSVRASLRDATATTVLDVHIRNPTTSRAEAVLLLPLPRGAVVGGFDFLGTAAESDARLLRADEARATYDEIVRRVRDPALLEFAGHDLLRSSVFPVEPGGRQQVRVRFEHLLEVEGGRLDYVLPRSENLARRVPWDVQVDVEAGQPVAGLYSPSHELVVQRTGDSRLSALVAAADRDLPGPFRLSCLLEAGRLSTSVFTTPDPVEGGGYFLVLGGGPAAGLDAGERPAPTPRELTLVVDRSGSMAGGKLDQARAACLQVVEGLRDGERFQLVDYSNGVGRFAAAPVVKDADTVAAARAWLAALRPGGGTNIHDALVAALRPAPVEGFLPLVLFLTDGLPTVGRTAEGDIHAAVAAANSHGKRVFTFGVGADVNAPLLDQVADRTRASAAYVLPGEDVERVVASVYRRLDGPVFTEPVVTVLDAAGAEDPGRVADLVPVVVPDLFVGDVMLLMGRYRGEAPFGLCLAGQLHGDPHAVEVAVDPARARVEHAFVGRLWAARQVAYLVDAIRQAGGGRRGGPSPLDDPRFAELGREILRLSTRFGILTEYTAFLATEGTDLADWDALNMACVGELEGKAVAVRSGAGAVSQAWNFNARKLQARVNLSNRLMSDDLEEVELGGVQQLADGALFKQGARWVDARLVESERATERPREVVFGSAAHQAVLDELVSAGRQALASLPGDVLLCIDDDVVLLRNPLPEPGPADDGC